MGRTFWRYVPDKACFLRAAITSVEKGTKFHVRYLEEEEEKKLCGSKPPPPLPPRKKGQLSKKEAKAAAAGPQFFHETLYKR